MVGTVRPHHGGPGNRRRRAARVLFHPAMPGERGNLTNRPWGRIAVGFRTQLARRPRGLVQVGDMIRFRRKMFGRIFAISHGVRAYFAPEPSAFARRGATRAKNASSAFFMIALSLYHSLINHGFGRRCMQRLYIIIIRRHANNSHCLYSTAGDLHM